MEAKATPAAAPVELQSRGTCRQCLSGTMMARDFRTLPYADVRCSRCGHGWYGVPCAAYAAEQAERAAKREQRLAEFRARREAEARS